MTTKVRIPRVTRRSAVDCELQANAFRRRFLVQGHGRSVDALYVFEQATRLLGFRPEVGTPAPYVKGLTDFAARVVQLDASMYDRIDRGPGSKHDPFASFVVLHEVAGHVFTHTDDVGQIQVQFQQTASISFAKQTDVDDEENAEWQADRIAAAVQMPAREVIMLSNRTGTTLPSVAAIARAFGVTAASASRRRIEIEQIHAELLLQFRQPKEVSLTPTNVHRYRSLR